MRNICQIFLLHSFLSTIVLAKHHKGEDKFDWPTFIIGSSCALETMSNDGVIDEAASEDCGECYDKIEKTIIEETKADIMRNCTADFLPNIYPLCKDVMEKDQDLKNWDEIMECMYGYVMKKDADGYVQAGVKEWMEDHHHNHQDKEKKWEYLLGGVCLAVNRQDESFNFTMAEKCGECFQHTEFRDCVTMFLPSLDDCTDLMYQKGEEAGMICFNNKLEMMDADGEARKMMKGYLEKDNSWSNWMYSLFLTFWSYVTSLF